jgi:hypothetical protein
MPAGSVTASPYQHRTELVRSRRYRRVARNTTPGTAGSPGNSTGPVLWWSTIRGLRLATGSYIPRCILTCTPRQRSPRVRSRAPVPAQLAGSHVESLAMPRARVT